MVFWFLPTIKKIDAGACRHCAPLSLDCDIFTLGDGPVRFKRHFYGYFFMNLAGFLLLLAGWMLVLATIMLLTAPAPRTAFALAGAGVEVLGLTLVFRSHLVVRKKRG